MISVRKARSHNQTGSLNGGGKSAEQYHRKGRTASVTRARVEGRNIRLKGPQVGHP